MSGGIFIREVGVKSFFNEAAQGDFGSKRKGRNNSDKEKRTQGRRIPCVGEISARKEWLQQVEQPQTEGIRCMEAQGFRKELFSA